MSKVLILDMIHGGDILAERMVEKGHDVFCADVYGNAPATAMNAARKIGAKVSKNVPAGHYDIVVSPVHCPDTFLKDVTWNERRTFHQVVGEIIDDRRFRIEVTGVKGKTSTCSLIAYVLGSNGLKVFVQTSREYGSWRNGKYDREGKMSISPVSMLKIPDGDHDAIVCEISLGGSGKADISLMTNMADDYDIAAGTRKASDAKASIFSHGKNIVRNEELDLWSRYGKDLNGYGGRVSSFTSEGLGKGMRMGIEYRGRHDIRLKDGYLAHQYIDSFEAALEVFDHMNIGADAVVRGLSSFPGVPGRGEISSSGGKIRITDRNPGISHISIGWALRSLQTVTELDDALVILDPVSKKVCDGLDINRIRETVSSYGLPMILRGEPVPDHQMTIEFIKEGYQ